MSFLITSLFTMLLNLLKSTETVANLSNLTSVLFKLFKSLGTFSNLSTSCFKLAKASFLANAMHQRLFHFLSLNLLEHQPNLIQLLFCLNYFKVLENNSFLCKNIFFINPTVKRVNLSISISI